MTEVTRYGSFVCFMCLLGARLLSGCAAPSAQPKETTPAPAATAPSDDAALWAGCEAEALEGTVRRATCVDAELRFMRAGQFRGVQGIAYFLKLSGLDPETPLQWSEGAGRIPFAVAARGDQTWMVSAPREDVVAVCASLGTTVHPLCEARFQSVAGHGLPLGLTFPAVQLSFLGAPLHVPEGCKMAGAERIVCRGASVDWRAGIKPGDPWPQMVNAYRTAGLTVESETTIACNVAGHAGEGRLLQVQHAQGSTQITACVASAADVRGLVACIGPAPAPGQPYPAPCDQLFAPSR